MGGRYYLRIPVPGGRGDQSEFVEVDPDRLHLGVLTDIYERLGPGQAGVQRRGARSGLKPALGAANTIRSDIDPAEVIHVLADLLVECRKALEPYREAGEQVGQILPDEENFRALIEALVRGRLEAAKDALTELLYRTMGASCTLADQLDQAQTHASAMEASRESLDAALREAPAITEQLYIGWAEAADTLNRSVQALAATEKDLETLLREAKGVNRAWQALISDQHPVIAEAMKRLDLSADSFNLWAFSCLGQPSATIDPQRIAEARRHIEACREQERLTQDAWQKTRDSVHQATAPRVPEIQRMSLWLEGATINLQRFESHTKADVARPYDIKSGALISAEDYQRASAHLTDPRWSPRAAQRRLEGIAASAMALVREMPRLPESVLAALTQAGQYLQQLEQLEQLPPTPVHKGSAEASPALPQARVEELYELVICAGCVLTCTPKLLAQSNIEALLEVLVQLNCCSKEEAETYQPTVVSRSQMPGEREEIPSGVSVRERWELSKARWLAYRVPRVPRLCLKLTETAGRSVPTLLAKHRLSEAEIRTAHQKRRELKLQQHQARKANRLVKGS
ncbi:hypothetical protein HY442_00160 [Candidatus Parcubacteria bacterium]|nr:hypothetical protein [Candidatus Parcubacteria bacterium]